MENALVILCGGDSSRMGSDKALLPFGNCCMVEYLVHKFEPYFSKIYLSVFLVLIGWLVIQVELPAGFCVSVPPATVNSATVGVLGDSAS